MSEAIKESRALFSSGVGLPPYPLTESARRQIGSTIPTLDDSPGSWHATCVNSGGSHAGLVDQDCPGQSVQPQGTGPVSTARRTAGPAAGSLGRRYRDLEQ